MAIKHFRYFLEGRGFTVFTDHKPIVAAIRKSTEPVSGRQARQLAAIAEATTDIRHVEGKANVVADALSRVDDTADSINEASDVSTANSTPGLVSLQVPTASHKVPGPPRVFATQRGLDYQELSADQDADADVQAYRTAVTKLRLQDVPFADGSYTVLCDVSTGFPRPIVPKSLRRKVFDTVHALSHPGVRSTKRLIASKFVWHGLNKEGTGWARSCLSCQRSKVQTHIKAPLQKFEPTPIRFDHVHVDLVGPLPESQGYRYLLTVMDRFTRWPEVVPIKDIEARTVARAYLQNWVARFGVPSQLTSDRGTQFVSELWASMSELLGTSLNPTTAYHPQSNGLIERLHRTLKASLKARLTSPSWVDELPWVMLGLRTTPKEDLNASPADLVYGSTLTVPGDFIPETMQRPISEHLRRLRDKMDTLKPIPASTHGAEHGKTKVPVALTSADFVFVRREAKKALDTPYVDPYKVLARREKYFTLQIGSREDKVSIDRLKVAVVDKELPIPVAQPPKRGRPPVLNKSTDLAVRGSRNLPEATEAIKKDPHPTLPTYAEITTRSGRTSKLPDRYK